MKTTLVALVLATLLGACVSGGTAPAQSANAGQSSGTATGNCDGLTIRTAEQYDTCRNQCRNEKSTREQQCNADSSCLIAAGAQTQKCFAKCDDGRKDAKAQNCFKE